MSSLETAESRSPKSRRFVAVVAAGAVLLVAIATGVVLLLAPVVRQVPTSARVPRTAVLPLPRELRLVAEVDTGCNLAGPEPEYLVQYFVVVPASPDAGRSALMTHFGRQGFDLTIPPAPRGWVFAFGRHERVLIQVGSAEAFKSFAGRPSLDDEDLVLEELSKGLTRSGALVMRLDLTGPWKYC